MNKQLHNILDYIGNDGEFIYPIDEDGNFILTDAPYDNQSDEFPIATHGLAELWERERQRDERRAYQRSQRSWRDSMMINRSNYIQQVSDNDREYIYPTNDDSYFISTDRLYDDVSDDYPVNAHGLGELWLRQRQCDAQRLRRRPRSRQYNEQRLVSQPTSSDSILLYVFFVIIPVCLLISSISQ